MTESSIKSRIPKFATREEEAEFWDTHDITDYWDELKPVKVRFPKKLSEKIIIPLDDESFARLQARAKELGTDPTALALQWVLDQLR